MDLSTSEFTVGDFIKCFKKRNKADSQVLERIRVTQAMLLAAETGRGPLVDQAYDLYVEPAAHENSEDKSNQSK
jgi:hypothetical protein